MMIKTQKSLLISYSDHKMLSCRSLKRCRITCRSETWSSNHRRKLSHEDSISSSSSSEQVASSVDLLLQILVCLPVKSLLAFKSVSKQWFSIISDPSFIRNHWLQNRRCLIPGLILYKLPTRTQLLNLGKMPPPEFEFFPLSLVDDGRRRRRRSVTNVPPVLKSLTFVDVPEGIHIESSCNGLLSCCSYTWSGSGTNRTYYIYNPSTKRYRTILDETQSAKQHKERGCDLGRICTVNLAFDPLKSLDDHHYQVVCVWIRKCLSQNSLSTYQIEIYSSRTTSWSLSGDAFNACHDTFGRKGVFWNGCLHWINIHLKEQPCFYFDLDRELMKTIPMPPVPDGFAIRRVEYFGECRGHLYLIENYYHPCTRLDIMEMDAKYTGWNVKYRVNLEPLVHAYPEMVRDNSNVICRRPRGFKVWFVEEDEEDSSSSKMILQLPSYVLSCDLKEMEFKKIHGFARDDTPHPDFAEYRRGFLVSSIMEGWFAPFQYMETLAHV